MIKTILTYTLAMTAISFQTTFAAYKDYHKCTVSNYYAYDGDTIYGDISCNDISGKQSFFKRNDRLRFARIDTAERRTANACEKRMSELAKDFITNKIKSSKTLNIEVVGEEYYGGLVVEVTADGVNLSSALLQSNLAVIYQNKKIHHTNWCDIEKKK